MAGVRTGPKTTLLPHADICLHRLLDLAETVSSETKLALWKREAVFGATVDLLTSDSPCHCYDFVPVFWSRTGYVQPCSLENGVNNAFAERSWGLKLRSPLAEAFCDDSTLNASVCIQYRRRVATSERNIIALQLGAIKQIFHVITFART